jgi:hypothetical protein
MNLHQQFNYITTSIKKGCYDASYLSEKIEEVIEEVRDTTFNYHGKSVFPDLKMHLKTYHSYGKRNKAKTIASLEDVQREMNSMNPSKRYMLFLINQIVETSFYGEDLQKKMLKEKLISRKAELQSEIVAVY